jgi:hypothetical protein
VHTTGYVSDDMIGEYLAVSDVALCLRWPTAGETSASWLRCLAAARPTVVTDLAQLAHVPTIDPRTWRSSLQGRSPAAVAIDLLNEEESLQVAMRRLASDRTARETLARSGYDFWVAEHTLERMTSDYLRVMPLAASRPAPRMVDLPVHFTHDDAELARRTARSYGVVVDILEAS